MLTLLTTARARLLTFTKKLAFLAPLLIRITVGLVFIRTGWGKLHTLDNVTEFFASLHIPMPGLNARVAASTEFFGGVLILIGLGARLVALPMAFTMVIAIVTARIGDVDGVVSLVGLEEWSYLVMFLVIALTGAGAASLDHLVDTWMTRSRSASASTPLASSAPAILEKT